MRKSAALLFFLLLSLAPALAQVKVEISLNQDKFLPGESMTAAVRITNRSGETLRLGQDGDWLSFEIQTPDGVFVPQIDAPPVQGEFTLESSSRATKRVDLGPHFSVLRPGRYLVTATVRIKQWGRDLTAQPFEFNVIEGSRLWQQDFGIPTKTASPTAAPEVRRYILQEANYLRSQLRLYLRVTDSSEARVYKTVPIGMMLTFSHPEPQIDQSSNLHLLYQSWAHTFTYLVFNPSGEEIQRETYDYIGDRPHLVRDREGNVAVAGGIRRPVPGEALSTNQAPAPLRLPAAQPSAPAHSGNL
ncbi:MAG TPA: hypothetical protein VHH88_02335 [Verrucomicrobiae bacterium]|nr:hypothetical protein [Verrucomicrobiae bacterium]